MFKYLLSQNFFRVYLFICVVAIEFLATTTIHIETIENSWDKANHFIAFFVLYTLLTFAFEKISRLMKIALLVMFGLQIEIVQSFIDGRFFSLLDVFADSVGIAIGVFLEKYVRKILEFLKSL